MSETHYHNLKQSWILTLKQCVLIALLLMNCHGVSLAQEHLAESLDFYDIIVEPVKHIYPNGHIDEHEAVCVINIEYYDDEGSQWFLLKRYGEHVKLGHGFTFFSTVTDIVASPDGKFLAITSSAEGHPTLEIVDLSLLLNEKKYHVLSTLETYPSGFTVESWKGNHLYVSSADLLTEEFTRENGYAFRLTLPTSEIYSLHVITGEITAVSEGANDPIRTCIQYLLSPEALDENKDVALYNLKMLKATSVIPELETLLQFEKSQMRKTEIQKLLHELSQYRDKGEQR